LVVKQLRFEVSTGTYLRRSYISRTFLP